MCRRTLRRRALRIGRWVSGRHPLRNIVSQVLSRSRSFRRPDSGPAQAGYLVQILLYGVFLALFLNHSTSGELARTGLVGRTALILSLSLNTVYTGLCFYEAFISSGVLLEDRRQSSLYFAGGVLRL